MKRPAGWARLRALRLELDGHRCVECGAGCPHPARHHDVDHIVPLAYETDPRRAADLGNLRTLCVSCHAKLGGGHRDGLWWRPRWRTLGMRRD